MPKPPKPDKHKRNYIDLPDEFEIPDTKDGDTFEAIAEIRRDGDRYCVVSLDGIPLKEEQEDADEAAEESLGAGAKGAMGEYA